MAVSALEPENDTDSRLLSWAVAAAEMRGERPDIGHVADLDPEEAEASTIPALAKERKFVVAQDAAHMMLTYGSKPLSFLSVPGAMDVGVEIHSLSKGFDMIGWRILDKKRVENKLPLLAETGRKLRNPGHEGFDRRQPQHILLAAKAGLGASGLLN